MAFFALTADRVYAMGATPKSRLRSSTRVGTGPAPTCRSAQIPGPLATKVSLDVTSTGEHFDLEATTVGDNGFTAAFLAELTANAERLILRWA